MGPPYIYKPILKYHEAANIETTGPSSVRDIRKPLSFTEGYITSVHFQKLHTGEVLKIVEFFTTKWGNWQGNSKHKASEWKPVYISFWWIPKPASLLSLFITWRIWFIENRLETILEYLQRKESHSRAVKPIVPKPSKVLEFRNTVQKLLHCTYKSKEKYKFGLKTPYVVLNLCKYGNGMYVKSQFWT